MRLQGSAFDPLRSPTLRAITPDASGSAKIGDWYGMITGRVGYAWDRVLLYVKGGAAFVPVHASVLIGASPSLPDVKLDHFNRGQENGCRMDARWRLEWAIYNN